MKIKGVTLTSLLVSICSASTDEVKHSKLLTTEPSTVIDGQYIVLIDESAERADRDVFDVLFDILQRPSTRKIYPTSKNYFMKKLTYPIEAGTIGAVLSNVDEGELLDILSSPEVILVEQDKEVTGDGIQIFAPWGLDRIDQEDEGLDSRYEYKYTGNNVDVFVLDTGIRIDHVDFGSRATCGFNAFSDYEDSCEDKESHGTGVASIIGGTRFGAAKNANIIAVKVLGGPDGRGSASSMIRGIEHVIDQKQLNPERPMVINSSIGTSISHSLNAVVDRAVEAGITFVASAGNQNVDSCRRSPASASLAITVGSIGRNDEKSSFSNYGRCVALFAPGESILSADTGFFRFSRSVTSGTSNSAPFVAGVVAMYLEQNPSLTPANVWEKLQDDALPGVVEDSGPGSPNLLLSTFAINTESNLLAASGSDCRAIFKFCVRNENCCSNSCRLGFCFLF